jgi:hypothetical protein
MKTQLTEQQIRLLKSIKSDKERTQQKARFYRENQHELAKKQNPDN